MGLDLKLRGYDLGELLTTRRGWLILGLAALNLVRPLIFQAARWYRMHVVRSTRLVAVAGTHGKSTAARMITAVLGEDVSRVTERNAGLYLAGKVFRIRPGDGWAVIEVGISRPGQMRSYARFMRPDIAVVMSIGSEHNRSLGTLDETREQKAEMVRALPAEGLAVLNGDDPQVRLIAREAKCRVVSFGLEADRDVSASNITLDWPAGTSFILRVRGFERQVRTRLIGRHMVYPALAAIALALEARIPMDEALSRLEAVAPTPGRMQPVPLRGGAIVLRDESKSTMESCESALGTLGQIPAGRRLVVLGEMTDARGSAYPFYRRLGALCADVCEKVIVLVWSSKVKTVASGARERGRLPGFLYDADRDCLAAADRLRSELREGDVVLIKGRRSQKLERISLALLGQRVRCRRPDCKYKLLDCSRCPSL